jgi:DNA-binding SARP family transcriptional activator
MKGSGVIVIEGQAGQGKSILASQFLNYNQLNYLWYHVGPEDADPFFFLRSIAFNLRKKYPGFAGIELETVLKAGKVSPLDIERCANLLLREIDRKIPTELYLVFDDIHVMSEHCLSAKLFDHLLDTSPPRLRFILISRYPLRLKCRNLRNRNTVCRLTNEDIAFSRNEVEEYLNAMLNLDIDPQAVDAIHRATGGWTMGVVLAGDAIQREGLNPTTDLVESSLSKQDLMTSFFRQEVLAHVPEELHTSFYKFALLSEIPVELARSITGRDDIGSILSDMAFRNLFVSCKTTECTTFYLHHSYREFLQQLAKRALPPDDIMALRNSEAIFYCDRGMIDKAIICHLQTGNWCKIERLLATRGIDLLNRNSMIHLLTAFESIPETTIQHNPWMSLYAGLMRSEHHLHSSLPFFEAARTTFNATGQEDGECVSLAMIIFYHIIVSGDYKSGEKLLPRLDSLLAGGQRISLPYSLRCLAARYLAFGYFLFNGDPEKAIACLALPGNPRDEAQHPSSIARCRFIRGYIELYTGSRKAFLREAEACFSLLNDPRVGMSDKLIIRILFLNNLSMVGDQLNFAAEKVAIEQTIQTEILDRTVATSNIQVWQSSLLFSAGQTHAAMEILTQGLQADSEKRNPHMLSQFLQWKAFGHALLQQYDASRTCIEESIMMREQTGGTIHFAFNTIIAGAVYSRIGNADLAESCFDQGIDVAKSIPSPYFLVCAYLNRSYHKLIVTGPMAALDDLRTGLVLMRLHELEYFWSWEPLMMNRLLTLAVQQDVERDFARTLARKKLDICLEDSGKALPQLHFALLDHFHIDIASQTRLHASDFSPSHRELLGILLTTKDQKISQDQVQLAIWPESTPANARRSFDTLMTRLRHRLEKVLPVSAKNYLTLKKGILELQFSQTDAVLFLELTKIALRHTNEKEWWQANNVFRHAFSLLEGLWPEDTFCSEKAVSFNSQLINRLCKATLAWSKIMERAGDTDGAVTLIERILHIHFDDERLISRLYSLYLRNHNRLKGHDILDRYTSALKRQDYSDEEIDVLKQEIISYSLKSMEEKKPGSGCA